jgi:threonine dehydratase
MPGPWRSGIISAEAERFDNTDGGSAPLLSFDDVRREVLAAEARIRAHVRRTPLDHSAYLSRLCGGDVYLKLENWQITGSFKLRGALNKVLSLTEAEVAAGVITSSTGNHASAVAYALHRFGIPGSVYMPEGAAAPKVAAVRLYQIEPVFHGRDCLTTELHAKQLAREKGMTYISPYNDERVIGGQGTVGLEIDHQIGQIDALLVPVGGGGLAAGICGFMRATQRQTEFVGCLPVNSPCMQACVEAGKIYEVPCFDTLSDGTAGNMEPDSITFPLCRDGLDGYEQVDEAAIADAIRLMLNKHYMLVEGSGALPVAVLMQNRERFRGRKVVLVISGAKISEAALKQVLG